MEVKERQHHLLEQYFFHCNCQACLTDLSEGSQNATENATSGLKCVKCEKPLQENICRKVKLIKIFGDIAGITHLFTKGTICQTNNLILFQSRMDGYMCSLPSCGHQITSADVQNRLQGLQCLLDVAFHLMEEDRLGTASV